METLTATKIDKAMPLSSSDVRNGLIDGIKKNKRGYIKDQELYNSAYSYARSIIYGISGVDTRTGIIMDMMPGSFLIAETTKENLLMRLSAIIQAGGYVDELP